MNLVSVIIPFYKKKKYITKTVKSVLKQTYKNFEIIIIYDDDELDDLKFVMNLKKIDKRIKVIKNKKNEGAGCARNFGIKNSSGSFIAFLDSDDIWHEKKLEIHINYMKKQNLLFTHSSYSLINQDGKIYRTMNVKKDSNYFDLIKSCNIGLSTVVIDKKIAKHIIFPNLKTKEDYVVWLKLAKKNVKIHGIPKILGFWRKTTNSLSSSNIQKIKDAYKVFNKYEGFGVIKSIYCVLVLSFNSMIKFS